MSLFWIILRYALVGGLIVSFLMLLWEFLMHRQWAMALVSLAFSWLCGGGFLIALIIGWQEAENWNIKKLMRIYTVFFVCCLPIAARVAITTLTTPRSDAEIKPKPKAKVLRQSLE